MRQLLLPFSFIALFAGVSGNGFAQQVVSQGIYGVANTASAGNVTLDWVIGSLVPDAISAFPVRLVSFQGKRNASGGADLLWKTADEFSNKGFEIQKSINGKDFLSIGWKDGINGDGEHIYHFTDPALQTTSYYRLNQVNLDGTMTFSGIVVVVPENESVERFTAFPNPTDGEVQLRLPEKTRELKVITDKGIIIHTQTDPGVAQSLRLPASGMHLLHIKTLTEDKTIRVFRK